MVKPKTTVMVVDNKTNKKQSYNSAEIEAYLKPRFDEPGPGMLGRLSTNWKRSSYSGNFTLKR